MTALDTMISSRISLPVVVSPPEALRETSPPLTLLEPVPASPSFTEGNGGTVPTHSRPADAGTLYVALIERVHEAVDLGVEVPCVGPGAGAWTSDDPTDQEIAAARCFDCPLALQCREYAVAAGERTGVWGGWAPELVARRQSRPLSPEARERMRARAKARRLAKKARSDPESGIVGARIRVINFSQEFEQKFEREVIGYPTMTSTNTGSCKCECGQATGPKANYRPGHDARHAAVVARAIAENPRQAKSLLTALPSAALQAKAARAADRLGATAQTDAAKDGDAK